MTRACARACPHCRADAIPRRHPIEPTTTKGCRLIDRVRSFGDPPPLFVLTGGNPVRRPDLVELVTHAVSGGLTVALTPSGTAAVTRTRLAELTDAGLSRLAVNLDGPDRETHDALPPRPRLVRLVNEDHRSGDRSGNSAPDQFNGILNEGCSPSTVRYPYRSGRAAVMSASYGELEADIRRAVLHALGRHGLPNADILECRISRWGYAMVVAKPGQLVKRDAAPCERSPSGPVVCHTDVQGAPAYENALASSFDAADAAAA